MCRTLCSWHTPISIGSPTRFWTARPTSSSRSSRRNSEKRDRRDKLAEYEDAGIPEYWLIDEPRHEAYFYVPGADGRYTAVPVDADGVYTSTVLGGLRLKVDWLWRSPFPTVEEALAELTGLIPVSLAACKPASAPPCLDEDAACATAGCARRT